MRRFLLFMAQPRSRTNNKIAIFIPPSFHRILVSFAIERDVSAPRERSANLTLFLGEVRRRKKIMNPAFPLIVDSSSWKIQKLNKKFLFSSMKRRENEKPLPRMFTLKLNFYNANLAPHFYCLLITRN